MNPIEAKQSSNQVSKVNAGHAMIPVHTERALDPVCAVELSNPVIH